MTGMDEEEPAPVWPDELRHERTISKYFAVASGIVIALTVMWIVDSSPRHLPPPDDEAGYNAVAPSGCFQNLYDTLGWLAGGGLLIACLFKAHRTLSLPEDTLEYVRLINQARLYAILGVVILGFPYLQKTLGAYSLEDFRGVADFAADLCWFFSIMAFLVGDINLRHAQRLKDNPTAETLKAYAAFCFIIGFVLLGAPALGGFLMEWQS